MDEYAWHINMSEYRLLCKTSMGAINKVRTVLVSCNSEIIESRYMNENPTRIHYEGRVANVLGK